jgi:hypothetical protein
MWGKIASQENKLFLLVMSILIAIASMVEQNI